MTLLERYKRAKERLQMGWTQGTFTRDKTGLALENSDSPDACAWCLYGALGWSETNTEACIDTLSKSKDITKDVNNCITKQDSKYNDLSGVAWWNDQPGRTKEDVIRVVDCMIATEEAKGVTA